MGINNLFAAGGRIYVATARIFCSSDRADHRLLGVLDSDQ
jgi:hypothetical protein